MRCFAHPCECARELYFVGRSHFCQKKTANDHKVSNFHRYHNSVISYETKIQATLAVKLSDFLV